MAQAFYYCHPIIRIIQMKSSLLKSLSVVALLSSTAPAFSATDAVVAIVNGQKFTHSDVMKAKASLPKQYQSLPDDKIFPVLVNQTVDIYLVDQAAQTSGELKKADVKEAIAKATKDIVAQAYILGQVKAKVTDAAVQAKCDEIIKTFKAEKELHLYHILVDEEDVAKGVIKALKGGTAFKKLAETKSKDTTGKQGGDLGYFRQSELPKELAEAAFALKVGAYSETPIKTDFGWHVLKVGEMRDAKPPKCDEIKNEIKGLLTQEAIIGLLEDLRKKAKVELFDKDGKPMPAKEAAKAPVPAATPVAEKK